MLVNVQLPNKLTQTGIFTNCRDGEEIRSYVFVDCFGPLIGIYESIIYALK